MTTSPIVFDFVTHTVTVPTAPLPLTKAEEVRADAATAQSSPGSK